MHIVVEAAKGAITNVVGIGGGSFGCVNDDM